MTLMKKNIAKLSALAGNHVLPHIAIFLLAGGMLAFPKHSVASGSEPLTAERPQPTIDGQVTAAAQFLRNLHLLILNPPMSPEKITATFGWTVIKQSEGVNGRYTYFDLYPNEIWRAPSLRQMNDGKTRIRIQLIDGYPCISSEEVIAEFGSDFKHSLASVDRTSVQHNESKIVERNLKLFAYGPRYEIGSPVIAVIGFEYYYSECLEAVSIGHPTF